MTEDAEAARRIGADLAPERREALTAGPRIDAATLQAALERAFEPARVVVRDDAALHEGHAGARAGGHFHVTVVSNRFVGVSARERHRLIYAALDAWMGSAIHALSIEARPFS